MKKKTVVLSLVMLAASLCAFSAERDAKADAVGKEFLAALGGENAWDKARQLKFDFVVEREGKTVARWLTDSRMRASPQKGQTLWCSR